MRKIRIAVKFDDIIEVPVEGRMSQREAEEQALYDAYECMSQMLESGYIDETNFDYYVMVNKRNKK